MTTRWMIASCVVLGAACVTPSPKTPPSSAPLAIVIGGNPDLSKSGIATTKMDIEEGYPAIAARVRALTANRSRVVLVGYGTGAAIAANIGVDSTIAGVVAIHGIYDLSNGVGDRGHMPPTLLLADDPESAVSARRFARALERAGATSVTSLVAPDEDHAAVEALVASFVAGGPRDLPLDGPWGVQQRWGRSPPLAHEMFTSNPSVVTRPVTGEIHVAMALLFDDPSKALQAWPLREYRAIPLASWLASRADVGSGDHLVITNLRGEQMHLTRADLDREEPVLVIGIDDETNLYRMVAPYRVAREASWIPQKDPMPVMARPMGPFLFFPKGAPAHLRDTTLAGFGLSPESFRFVSADPLAHARSLAPELRETLIGAHGCLKCHSLRGEGARAHHTRAIDGKPHGGFALGLEEYSREILHAFLFDQETVSKSFGVTPLPVPEKTATALFDLVASPVR